MSRASRRLSPAVGNQCQYCSEARKPISRIPASMVGGIVITALPKIRNLGLEFINPAVYITLLIPLMKSWIEVGTALLAIPVLILISSLLPHVHAVLVTMILVILAGGSIRWLRQPSSD